MEKTITIILFALLILSSCAVSDNFGEDGDENKTQQIIIQNSDLREVYRTAIQLASIKEWEIQHSDIDAGYFRVEYAARLSRWGDTVNITLTERGDQIIVTARSTLGQRPNRELVEEYLNELREDFK